MAEYSIIFFANNDGTGSQAMQVLHRTVDQPAGAQLDNWDVASGLAKSQCFNNSNVNDFTVVFHK